MQRKRASALREQALKSMLLQKQKLLSKVRRHRLAQHLCMLAQHLYTLAQHLYMLAQHLCMVAQHLCILECNICAHAGNGQLPPLALAPSMQRRHQSCNGRAGYRRLTPYTLHPTP